jgi:hypothetical protein
MIYRRNLSIIVLLSFLVLQPAILFAEEEVDPKALLDELRAVKAKLAEMEPLIERVAELEQQLEAVKQQHTDPEIAEENGPAQSVEQDKENDFEFKGAISFNYFFKDFDERSKDVQSDWAFNYFRIGADGEFNDLILSAEYAMYHDMHFVRHAWIGYDFSKDLRLQLGVTKVPFGILPFASNSFWEGIGYELGLEDDRDMGLKLLYSPGDFDLQLAFYKNEELGSSTNNKRYSFDVVRGGIHDNEETNQFNARMAYTLRHGSKWSTELGLSGQWGQLYNTKAEEFGSHWAAAAHLNGQYDRFNLMLQAAHYEYLPKTPYYGDPLRRTSERVVQMGGLGDSFLVAAKGTVYTANIAYAMPVDWGPITQLRFYNDYSLLDKDRSSFADSHHNVSGVQVSAGNFYAFMDIIAGKNDLYAGGSRYAYAQGESDADWHTRINLNFGYTFGHGGVR